MAITRTVDEKAILNMSTVCGQSLVSQSSALACWKLTSESRARLR